MTLLKFSFHERAKMIQIEWSPDEGLSITEGVDEFVDKIERNGTVLVFGAKDGKAYYYHEVGEQVYLLNQDAQNALISLADDVIQEASTGRWH
jgi:hypothetical protein